MRAVASSPNHCLETHALVWRREYTALLLVLGSVVAIGAGYIVSNERRSSVEPILYAVEGKVLVDGEPAENLNVAFHPISGDKHPYCPVGRTNSRGVFHLMTRRDADGAPAGKYCVTLVWPDGLLDECEVVDPTLHDRLKGSYANAGKSNFQVTVAPSSNSFWFNAQRPRTSEPRKRK